MYLARWYVSKNDFVEEKYRGPPSPAPMSSLLEENVFVAQMEKVLSHPTSTSSPHFNSGFGEQQIGPRPPPFLPRATP